MLPLRLMAEPILRSIMGHCFILPSAEEDKLCFVVSDAGLVALVTEGAHNEDVVDLSGIKSHFELLPAYVLSRIGSDFSWYKDCMKLQSAPSKEDIVSCTPEVSKKVAKRIVESIGRYYARQVLEPSIRGFLAILEKQFPRNDLYLFELLQNAVDDGATNIILCDNAHSSSDKEGVLFCHNGRRFTPLDVLGLASVGLSTKGGDEKRKIGFMGVGFKAVYKRYARVMVYDDVWSFCFDEPSVTPAMEPSHSWVMKPQWAPQESLLGTPLDDVDKSSWCHFLLQRPRGGMRSVKEDLSRLPSTAPVLLGRQAFASVGDQSGTSDGSPTSWNLTWQNKRYEVTRDGLSVVMPHTLRASILKHKESVLQRISGEWIRSFADTIKMKMSRLEDTKTAPKEQLWQFLTVCFRPSEEAQRAFEVHTKKKWAIGQDSAQTEDISIFFEISCVDGLPVTSPRHTQGTVHAILPTKLRVPSPVHVQGPWLLSVDRQDVQSIQDNCWNNTLLAQLPRLYVSLLRWLCAKHYGDGESLQRAFKMLPIFTVMDKSSAASSASAREQLCLRVLDQWVSMEDISHALGAERLTPVLQSQGRHEHSSPSLIPRTCPEISFVQASEAIWLPPQVMEHLTVDEVTSWLGCPPFASMCLGESSWHDMWRYNVPMPTIAILRQRKRFFRLDASVYGATDLKVARAVAALAAMGAALATVPPSTERIVVGTASAAVTAKQSSSEVGVLCGGWLPSLDHWPLFLSDNGEFVTALEIAWPISEEFMDPNIPPSVLTALRKGVVRSIVAQTERTVTNSHISKQNKKRHRSSLSNPEVPPVAACLLDADVEMLLFKCRGKGSGPERLALTCIEAAQRLCPSRLVGVEAASRALLQHWATTYVQSPIPVNVVHTIVDLFRWCMTAKRPGAVSHLLVGEIVTSAQATDLNVAYKDLRLLHSKGSYIPSLNEQSGNVCSCSSTRTPTESLPYVSAIYYRDREASSADSFARWFKTYHAFLSKCGAQSGVALMAFKRRPTSLEIESLPDKCLPKLRQTTTAIDMALPFNLGLLTKKTVEVVDVDIATEWADILVTSSKDTTAASAISVLICQLLDNADYAHVVTAESTPYAAPLLRGKVNEEIDTSGNLKKDRDKANHRVPSDVDRFPPPGFARMFYLPPGQPGILYNQVLLYS